MRTNEPQRICDKIQHFNKNATVTTYNYSTIPNTWLDYILTDFKSKMIENDGPYPVISDQSSIHK